MWDLPRPGFEPVSPALAGRFSTTAPPGKPVYWLFCVIYRTISINCCWSEANRLQNISPAHMGLFGIIRELQFWVCHHGESHASPMELHHGKFPCTAREELFYRGEKEVGMAIVKKTNPWLFIGWVLVRKEEESFFFLLGSAVGWRLRDSPSWSPNSI